MAAFADQRGFTAVSVDEHHLAENGWLPSPLLLGAMIVARTERVAVNVTALLIPLYDPIKLVEDIAVLDLASGAAVWTTSSRRSSRRGAASPSTTTARRSG